MIRPASRSVLRHSHVVASCIAGIMSSLLLVACVPDLDTHVQPARSVSLGEKIYTELCNRVASGDDPTDVAGLRARPVCERGQQPLVSASPRLKALHTYRASLIRALNDVIPSTMTNDIDTLMASLLPLYDQNIMQPGTRSAASLLADIAADPQTVGALARMSQREGYRQTNLAPGLIQPTLRYPQLQALTRALMNTFGDGGPGAPAFDQLLTATQHTLRNANDLLPDPNDPQHLYIDARDMLLAEHDAHSDGTARWVIRRDQRGMAQVASVNNTIPAPFTDTNRDGLADINDLGQFISTNRDALNLPAPFTVTTLLPDVALPNVADTDEPPDVQSGLVSDYDQPDLAIPERRNASGLALSPSGAPVYNYLNASRTMLSGMLHETRTLIQNNPGILIDGIAPIQLLLGTPSPQTYTFDDGASMTFNGYNVDQSPLLDLAHASRPFLDKPFFPPWVSVQSQLLDKEIPVAELADLLSNVLDWLDEPAVRNAQLTDNNLLIDDMLAWVIDVAHEDSTSIYAGHTHTLLGRLFEAMKDERTQALGPLFAKHMRYRDAISFNPANINGPAIGGFNTPVDRTRPDTRDNRSIMERFLHLVHDTNGAQMCNKEGAVVSTSTLRTIMPAVCDFSPVICEIPLFGPYRPCALIQIDNMAIYYMESIVGQAVMSFKDPGLESLTNLTALLGSNQDLLEQLSGITGFRKHPTPQALNRFIFAPRNQTISELVNAPTAFDGTPLEARHPGTIFAWELEDFYDKIRPLIQAFVDHGRPDLLANLMSILHRHYPSAQNDTTQSIDANLPVYSHKTGVVQFEEVIARALDAGRVMQVNRDLITTAAHITVPDHTGALVTGQSLLEQLARFALTPNAGLAFRNGSTVYYRTDNTPLSGPMTPAHMLVQALRDTDHALDRSPPLRQAWQDAFKSVRHQFLTITTDLEGAHFANRRLFVASQNVMQFAEKQIQRHVTRNTLNTWARDLPINVRDTLRHPITASLVQILDVANNNPTLQQQLDHMLLYLLDNSTPSSPFGYTVTALADQFQAAADIASLTPFLHHMADTFTLNSGLIDAALRTMQHIDAIDPNGIFPRLLANMVTSLPRGTVLDQHQPLPLFVFADVITAVQRAQPGPTAPMSPTDAKAVCTSVSQFLSDKTRGLERLSEIITHRHRPQ